MREKGKAVRLTDEAHWRLAEMAEDYNSSQKEIASEAILVLGNENDRNKQLHVLLNRATSEIHDIRYAALGAFMLGAVIGATLMLAVEVLL